MATKTTHIHSLLFRALLALAFVAFVGSATEVAAAPKQNADDLIKQGIELRRAGRDNDALGKFEQAYSASKSARAAAQVGLCLQALGRWSEADPYLSEALSAGDDAWVKKNREVLKDSLEAVKSHVARLEILGPAGARVSVNGRDVGTLPMKDAVLVNEGMVDLEASAPGHRTDVRSVNVAGSSYQRIVFRLQPETKDTAVAKAPSLDNMNQPPPETKESLTLSEPANGEVSSSKKWIWIGAGAAVIVAAAVVTAVLLSSSGAKDPTYDDTFTFE